MGAAGVLCGHRGKVIVIGALMISCMLLLITQRRPNQIDESIVLAPAAIRQPQWVDPANPVETLPPIPDDDARMTVALFRYIENPQSYYCRQLVMFGGILTGNNVVDGDKFVCLDPEHAPSPGACLVYSVGINYEWSFDRQISQYGCELHCFDPSMTRYNRTVTEFGAHFYKIGLSGRTELRPNGWQMMTLTDIRLKLGHTERDIHYLKVDIEGSEWSWLQHDAHSLRGVRQLGMEVHMSLDPAGLRSHYAAFRTIQQAGFVLVHVNANRAVGRTSKLPGVAEKVSSLYELVWVRRV